MCTWGGSEPPSYSASTADDDDDGWSESRRGSCDEEEGEGRVLEKPATGTNDREKDEEGRGRTQLQTCCHRAPDKWRCESGGAAALREEKKEEIWREGGEIDGKGSGRGDRKLSCCGRIICGECIEGNARFGSYCPFCQVGSGDVMARDEPPPSYESLHHFSSGSNMPSPTQTQAQAQTPDTLHYLSHPNDTLTSLSLRYQIPIEVLRKKNRITSDHLLLARKTVLIPGEWYKGGQSLSPRPIAGEEEERKKGALRRFMVGCKVFEYDIAVLYLEQANYDLELAMGVYRDDERWEKENPISNKGKGKGKTKFDVGMRRFTGYVS